MSNQIRKKGLLFLTLIFYFIFMSGFASINKYGILRSKYQSDSLLDNSKNQLGIDPTPIPPIQPPVTKY